MLNSSGANHMLPGIAQTLILDEVVSEEDAISAHKKSKDEDLNFVECLIKHKNVPAIKIAEVGARNFGVPFLDLESYDVDIYTANIISNDLLFKYNSVPLFKRGEHLFLATDDPSNQELLN